MSNGAIICVFVMAQFNRAIFYCITFFWKFISINKKKETKVTTIGLDPTYDRKWKSVKFSLKQYLHLFCNRNPNFYLISKQSMDREPSVYWRDEFLFINMEVHQQERVPG